MKPLRPMDAIFVTIFAAMLACGGCIAPTYNIFVGGDHKHDGTKKPTPEPDSRVDEVRRILDVENDETATRKP